MVLAGRCYERESVPKALEASSMSSEVPAQPADAARALLPRDIAALARCFRYWSIERFATRVAMPRLLELRRRAFSAFRELLGRIADRRPLVMFIDDLQWGDVDSAMLLADVIPPPDGPVLDLIAVYRDVEVQTSPFLRSFLTDDIARSQSFLRLRVDPPVPKSHKSWSPLSHRR